MKTLALVLFAVACQRPTSSRDSDATAPVSTVSAARTTPSADRTTAPWRLTASDGSGLALTSIDARAVVQGPLAYTELHLAFRNEENRIREGTFAIDLPAGATVSRFAMEIDGGWMEAEVVPKRLGRIAYDDALHARRDPALLERGAGNAFTAKVFPIPARGDKKIILAFSQPLRGEAYTLPLRGLPQTEHVAVSLDGAVQLDQRNWTPDRDFVAPIQAARAAVGNGLIAAVVTLPRDATPVALDELTVLVDTSASRAIGFAAYVEKMRAAIAKLPAKRVEVVAFDQDTEVVYDGPPAGFVVAPLVQRGAAGASDLSRALSRPLLDRVVVVTDGVITVGEMPKVERRVDVVLTGGGTLDLGGSVLDLDQTAPPFGGAAREHALARDHDDLARELQLSPPPQVPIVVEGAAWSYPKFARAGETIMVYAVGPSNVVINGQRLATVEASSTLIGRAVAAAEIDEMEAKHDPALASEIEKKSIASRVISSQTSMIVLEHDTDYARYDIERTANEQVLEVDARGQLVESSRARVKLADRKRLPAPRIAPPVSSDQLARQEAVDQARNAGVLGSTSFSSLSGTGDISSGFDDANVYGGLLGNEAGEATGAFGYGRTGFGPGGGGTAWGSIGTGRYGTIGHGAGTGNGYGVGGGRGGMRGRVGSYTTVRLTVTDIGPGLDRAIARRYLKRRNSALVACHDANQGGDVEVRFTIDANGRAKGASATGAPALAHCIEGVIDAIEMPHPAEGAVVQVRTTLAFAQEVGGTMPAPANDGVAPLTGKLADVMAALKRGDVAAAEKLAAAWHDAEPVDVLGLIAMGEVYEANGRTEKAARMYGSLIDLYSTRAEMMRFAGERLLRAKDLPLAVSAFRTAVSDRPDHLTGHRLLAYALLRNGDATGALAAIQVGLAQKYPANRFLGGERILREDLGMIAAHLRAHGEPVPASIESISQPSTRFVLSWETDGNDVDFHISDAKGNHAWYAQKQLASGGELYADVTTGFGPECFTIQGKPTAGPYQLALNYFSQGPEGYGMGLLEVQRFDGRDFVFEDRPFVIMQDHAFVDLGTL